MFLKPKTVVGQNGEADFTINFLKDCLFLVEEFGMAQEGLKANYSIALLFQLMIVVKAGVKQLKIC